MDPKTDNVSIVRALRTKFYNEHKETKLFEDVCNESIVRRAVPITVTLSVTIYYAIRHGFLRSRGLKGILFKNMLCMGVGVCGASVGIKSRYYDKLALFYLSCRYDELRKVLQFESTNPESPKYESNQSHVKHFEKPHYLNLDEIDFRWTNYFQRDQTSQPKYITYAELQKQNREAYAIKRNTFYI